MAWRPDKKEALKKLIGETIRSAGAIDPAELPHHVREQLKAQGVGETDIDELLKEVIEAQAKK